MNRANVQGFLFVLFGFRKARKPSVILLGIAIHVTGWCLFFFLPVLLYPVRFNETHFLMLEAVDKSLLVGLFYLNYYFLLPRFFEKKRYAPYLALVFLLFALFLAQHLVIREWVFPWHRHRVPSLRSTGFPIRPGGWRGAADSGRTVGFFRGPEPILPGIPRGAWPLLLNNATSSFLLIFLLGGFIRMALSFARSQNEKRALENARLHAELNFLKSQMNPHFLFNTLNGIYSLAHVRSPKTESAILQLSGLLRYQLYEAAAERVDLTKDIQYITHYIDLQKMRLSERVRVDYQVEGILQGLSVSPLLLISFVENAFKHGISYRQESRISICIRVFEKTLTLDIVNPIAEKNTFARGGIGLKNVSRRLELLYTNHYLLDIRQNEGLHSIHLKLELTRDKLPGH